MLGSKEVIHKLPNFKSNMSAVSCRLGWPDSGVGIILNYKYFCIFQFSMQYSLSAKTSKVHNMYIVPLFSSPKNSLETNPVQPGNFNSG